MLVVGLLLAIRTWVAEPVLVPTASMAPTLWPGDHVLVDKVGPRVREWHRGDVVLLRSPDGGLAVKRVVGLPGDRVAILDGRLHRAGRAVPEPAVDPEALDSVYWEPPRVPDGHVLVLGDHRADSVDSREWGPVPVGSLVGRVTLVMWPVPRFGGVS